MFDFLFAGAFAPFSFALVLLFGLLGLKLVALVLGGSLLAGDNDAGLDAGADIGDVADFDELDLDPASLIADPGELELAKFEAHADAPAVGGVANWLGLGRMRH